jgi:hypothetical protein
MYHLLLDLKQSRIVFTSKKLTLKKQSRIVVHAPKK